MITFIKYFLLFLVILVLQVFVLDQAPQIIPYARPVLFFAFIIALPEMYDLWLMGIAFTGGLLLDILYGTPGINAAACVLLAYLKVPLIRLIKKDEEENSVPSGHITYLGFTRYLIYILVVSLLFHFVTGFLSVFTFAQAGQTILRAIVNTIVSVILIYIFEIIFFYRRSAKI